MTATTRTRGATGATGLDLLWEARAQLNLPMALAALTLLGEAGQDRFLKDRHEARWVDWSTAIAEHAWTVAEAAQLAQTVLDAGPGPAALETLAASPHPELPRALCGRIEQARHHVRVARALLVNAAVPAAERDALLEVVLLPHRAQLKRSLSLSNAEWAAVTPHTRRRVAAFHPHLPRAAWIAHLHDTDLLEVVATRLTSAPLTTTRALMDVLVLLHPAVPTPDRKRRSLRRHVTRARQAQKQEPTAGTDLPGVLNLIADVDHGTVDPHLLPHRWLQEWLRVCADIGPAAFEPAVATLLDVDPSTATWSNHLDTLAELPVVPASLTPGSLLHAALDRLGEARLGKLANARPRLGALGSTPLARLAQNLLLERALAGSGPAFAALTDRAAASVPDHIVQALPWQLVRRSRHNLLIPHVAEIAQVAGAAGVTLLLHLETTHQGPLPELTVAVRAALT